VCDLEYLSYERTFLIPGGTTWNGDTLMMTKSVMMMTENNIITLHDESSNKTSKNNESLDISLSLSLSLSLVCVSLCVRTYVVICVGRETAENSEKLRKVL